MKLLILLALTFVFSSCNKSNEPQTTVKSKEEILADSLQNAADIIAEKKRLHSLMTGRHIHKPGDNLAETAHQNLPQKERMRKFVNENRESKKIAARAHAERLSKALAEQSDSTKSKEQEK